MKNKYIVFLTVIIGILLVNFNTDWILSAESAEFPYLSEDSEIIKSLEFLQKQQENSGSIGGFSVSGWVCMALSCAGQQPDDWGGLVDYLEERTYLLDDDKPEDWERQTLAIVACNKNPQNFSDMDFVEKIIGFYDGDQIGSTGNLFDDYFGILALISAGVSVNESIIQNTKSFIITKQNSNGGWGDSDSTAAAIMALVAAGENKDSNVIYDAINFLKNLQTDDGGFHSWGNTNVASTAWVVMALNIVDKDATSQEWEKNGKTPIEYILSLQQEDGSFNWTSDMRNGPEWMTAYAIPALMGKNYPIQISEDTYIINNTDEVDVVPDDEDTQESEPDIIDPDDSKANSEEIIIDTKDPKFLHPCKNTYYFLNREILIKNSRFITKKPVVFGLLNIKVETNQNVSKLEFYINNELAHTDFEKPYNYTLNRMSFVKKTLITAKSYIFMNVTIDYSVFLENIFKSMEILEKTESFNIVSEYFKPIELYAPILSNVSEMQIIYTNLSPYKYSKLY